MTITIKIFHVEKSSLKKVITFVSASEPLLIYYYLLEYCNKKIQESCLSVNTNTMKNICDKKDGEVLLYVTKIKINPGLFHSMRCEDIESVYLKGAHSETVHLKETVHAFLCAYPGTIAIECKENRILEAVTSPTGIQYVRTKDCQEVVDPIIKLPKV